jgi:hypothetical protein
MALELARMEDRGIARLGADDGGRMSKALEGGQARMSEAVMLDGRGGGRHKSTGGSVRTCRV